MRLRSFTLFILPALFLISCNSSEQKKEGQDDTGNGAKVELTDVPADQKVDITIDGKPFTTYCYSDTLMKQILYPVLTEGGNPVTRGWPIAYRPGERTDHPHQRGLWLNYGDVNGYDFWGNSYQIAPDVRKIHCGRIQHVKIDRVQSGTGQGTLITEERWLDPFGKELLAEKTTYHFTADGSNRIIDRITTLTATDSAVHFKDTKEGMFAIRVNHQLELPMKEAAVFKDAQGNPTTVKSDADEEVTGNYSSSEGVTGDSVWATRAKWMNLYGSINNEKVSLVICDHPKNLNYPTYWHARGYGLFSANPLGEHDFTDGKQSLNFTLAPKESVTLRYRVIISSGDHLTNDQINNYAQDFAGKYE
ncbi:MAG: PmoA family protein [Chitinophagaceae bacterium]|nr:PmoA family protein [Chitinophagaceae bacterium]